jgi:hypothetical protein
MPTRCNNGGLLILNIINISSICFGCLYTHHQEGRSCCVLLQMVLCSANRDLDEVYIVEDRICVVLVMKKKCELDATMVVY